VVSEKRLIDGNKAQAVLVNMAEHLMEAGNPEMAGAVGYAAEVIGKQRAVDAVEVVHGRWEQIGYDKAMDRITCSCCLEYWNIEDNDTETFNYCPNCGAKMDGGNEDV
jgi:hypothetical protein